MADAVDAGPRTPRRLLLDALDRWLDEGELTAEQHARLRRRVETDAHADLDAALRAHHEGTGAAPGASGHVPREERGSFAVNAMQFVGGLLLGAALVALTFFLGLDGTDAGWALLGFGAIGVGAGVALHFLLPDRQGLEEAALAAGLVPLALAPSQHIELAVVGLLAMVLAAGVVVLRRGDGPSVLVAAVAYVVASFAAIGPELFGHDEGNPHAWWLAVLALAAVMLVWRDRAWTSAALGIYVAPLTFSFFPLLDAWGIHTETRVQLALGAYLAVWLVLGIALGIRGLVAGAAAGLTIDSVAFAANLGGPGTAVVVLLVLGGLLVWQAEFLRSYFGRRDAARGGLANTSSPKR